MSLRHRRKVFSHDSGDWILCAWDDCENDGVELHKAVKREYGGRTYTYVFCSERHKVMWANSHRSYGNLPTGSRGMLG